MNSWITAGDMVAKRRLIVHPGTHKTGTSSIQNYLFTQRQRGDFGYLQRGRANSSLWMEQAFATLPDNAEGKALANRREARKDLAAALGNSRHAVDILSAESISSFTIAETRDFHQFVRPYYDEIEVHIYFRPMKSKMESAFQQRLQGGFSSIYTPFTFAYFNRVTLLDTVFGCANVHVHRYSSGDFPAGDVTAHFMRAVGGEWAGNARRKSNRSLSLEAIRLLYVYRMHFPRRSPEDRQLISRLGELPGSRLRFHSSLYERLLGNGGNNVEAFEQRAGFSIREDITRHDDCGLRCEEDLTSMDAGLLDWLREAAGPRYGTSAEPASDDLAAIAHWVRRLAS